jgi:hypothetical protein
MKSARNIVSTYLMGRKLFLKTINISDIKVAKNNIPAAALISLSFNTGKSSPCTSSPNCNDLFISLVFDEHFCKYKG